MGTDKPLVGEVQEEFAEGRWRTAHLGENVTVRDRRRAVADPVPPASASVSDALART
jgi:hypothetical protein